MRHRAWIALIGLAVLGAATPARASEDPLLAREPHRILVKITGFEPATLQIQRGDVVRWEWESGSFTIYSGANPDDTDNLGKFPEFVINGENRAHDLTAAELGDFPFHAVPGFQTMHGLITVREATPVNLATWGKVKRLFGN
jgi:plastocyanin